MKTWMKPAFFLLAGLCIWAGISGCSDSGSVAVSTETQTNRVHPTREAHTTCFYATRLMKRPARRALTGAPSINVLRAVI